MKPVLVILVRGEDVRTVLVRLARRYGLDPAMALDGMKATEFAEAVQRARLKELN